MPLPVPRKGESKDAFVTRCMGDEVAKADFKDVDQRLAVCLKQEQIRGEPEHPDLPAKLHLGASVKFDPPDDHTETEPETEGEG
jgi:hypothetical protein